MKLLKLNSLITRLAAVSAALLFSQQALAVGTPAGTPISNEATVAYSVGLVPQASITSAPVTFVVDNRADFTLVADPNSPIVPVQATVGDLAVAVRYILMNTGNQTQDFLFVAANEADGTDVDGFIDSGDMNNLTVVADNDDDGNPNDADNFIDELAPDTSRFVWIVSDANTPIPNQLLDGDIAHLLLTGTVAAGGGSGAAGAALTPTATDDPDAEDIVLAVGGVLDNGSASAQNGVELESASLTITKMRTLISDPFNGTTDPFYIPGAVVEFQIDVVNTSLTTAADAVIVTDILDGNVTIVNDPFGSGEDFEVLNDGAAITPCTADDTDGDGCSVTGGLVTIGEAGVLDISVAADTTMTIRFQVTIN